MASSVIGALRILMGIDTAQFDKGAKQVQSKLRLLGIGLKSFAAGFAGTLSAGGIAIAFKGIINHMDNMGKAAQRLGIPVAELSRLKLAADLADVSFEQLSTGVSRLSRNMASVAGGATNEVATAFRTLGINVQNVDGTMKSATQVMIEIASKFVTMKDGAQKTALAIQLFGRAGQVLIPLLNEGAAGLAATDEEARKLGIELDQRTAKAAELFNDNLTRLLASLQGFLIDAVRPLLPLMGELTTKFINWIKEIRTANTVGDTLRKLFLSDIITIKRLALEWQRFTMWVGIYKDVITTLGRGAIPKFQAGLQRSAQMSADLEMEIRTLRGEFEGYSATVFGTDGPIKATEDFGDELDIINTKAEKAAETIRKTIAQQFFDLGQTISSVSNQIASIGMGAGGLARLAASEQFYNELKKDNIILSNEQILQANQQLDLIARQTQKLDALSAVYDQLSSGLSSFADGIIDAASGVRSWGEMFKSTIDSMIRDLARLFLNRFFQMLLGMGFQNFLGTAGGPINIVPAGMRQRGGRVRRGHPYIVGERGPEMFVPRTTGSIVPNSAMGYDVKIIDQRTTASPPVESRTGNDGSQEFIIRDTIRRQLPGELNRIMPAQFGSRPRLNQRGS